MLKRISKLVLPLILLFIIFNTANNPTMFNLVASGVILISILTWSSIHRLINKIPKIPENIELVGFIMITYYIYKYLELTTISSSPHGLETFIYVLYSMFIGIIIWYITMVAIINIYMRVIDIENNVQNDSFNDPLAAKILNEDN